MLLHEYKAEQRPLSSRTRLQKQGLRLWVKGLGIPKGNTGGAFWNQESDADPRDSRWAGGAGGGASGAGNKHEQRGRRRRRAGKRQWT